MIKDNQKMLNRFHVIMDGILIAVAFAISYYLRYLSPLTRLKLFALKANPITGKVYVFTFMYYMKTYGYTLLFIIPGYLLIYQFCNLYTPKRSKNRFSELFNIIKANIVGIVYFSTVLFFFKEIDWSRAYLGVFFIVNITFTFTFRLIVIRVLRIYRKKGFNLKHVVLVGYSRATERYINRIIQNPQWGYYIHGILDDSKPIGTSYKGIKVIGHTERLNSLLAENSLDEIAITLKIEEYANLEHIVHICEKSGVHTKFIPDYNNIIPTRPYTEDLDGLPVINIRNVPLSNTGNKIVKRCIDIFGALVALLIFGIPMIIVSIIIKTTSKGPLIFSQVRVGLHNKEFKMYKFRSMEVQAPSNEKKCWTTVNDPRVTPIGKFIRKTSIDELPQLFNVLKGDMSLIGPRPERPYFVNKFKEEIPRYMIKHQVRPGLTGWAQINGYRGDTSIKSRIEHDLYYIENWSLALDFKILLMTFYKGFINKNAY
ncbi:capsular polysaccharide biosynthesis protein [Lachnospiraceae bacterium KM106-2]|nr:capsular polysaccharide biosynthesis protein [Lachnospiraceae bacterium KM106-2]